MRGLRDLGVRCLALLLWLAPLAAAAALPDTPRPRQFTVADGLPSNRINALVEDRHGYLWIATSDGLARYDGTGFRIWREEQGLPNNFVWSLALDADGRLWIGTAYGGLAVYEPEEDRFRYINRANTPGLGNDEIWSLAVMPDGTAWIGTATGGLHRLTPDGRMTRFMPRQGDDRSLPGQGVIALAAAPDGTLWVGTTGGVVRWTGGGFERLANDGPAAGRINNLHLDGDGTLWVGTTAGVVMRHADGRLSPAPWEAADPDLRVMQVLLHDSRGDCWLDVPKGLGHVSAGRVSDVPLYSEAAQGLVRPQWTAAHEDREGGVWLVSNSHGLWYQPAHWSQFAVLSRRLDDPDTLANAHVRAIAAASDGGMWLVGSGGALDWFDPESGAIRHVMTDVGERSYLGGVHEDRHGRVWVGWRGGLARIEPRTGRIRRWSGDQQVDATRGEAQFFVETGDGLLWLTFEDGVVQARDADGRVRREYLPGADGSLEPGEIIRHMRLGPDGAPWLATTLGLKRLLPADGRWAPVPGAGSEVRSDLAVLDAERVWLSGVGTLQRCRWDGSALDCEPGLGPDDGLPRLMFGGMAVDADGVAWLTSVRGLVRVDPEARTVRIFSAWDGLPGQEFAHSPVAWPVDGRVLAATPDGLVVFDPARMSFSGRIPSLVIERIDVRGRGAPVRFAPELPFAIDHDDRDLRVVARLLSFRNTAANVYAFRLEGHDEDWVETAAAGERIFSQLAPGRYTLQVRARNADNIWSQTHELSFEVRPPWWKTPSALALFVAAGLLLAWWAATAYRTRLRR
ncbi:ligand-binding sensor domain-containing protein, partial [Luteimonas suaedae]|uniref:ligand-binding sensor domain-containing protein n=1 Tax=Luteimonas suaedae TaxID=2605430 RepID=UPI0011EDA196